MREIVIQKPQTLDALVGILDEMGVSAKFLAGGTDLIIELRKGTLQPTELVDLSGIQALQGIKEEGDDIHIGAMTTFCDMENSSVIKRYATCLYDAAKLVGSTQIRNTATIGGNICNASPAADGCAALLALGAEIWACRRGENFEWMRLDEFLSEKADKKHSEPLFLREIRIKKMGANERAAFAKLGNRSTVTISQLILAGVVAFNADTHVIERATLVLGAVGRNSFVDHRTSNWLLGQHMDCINQRALYQQLKTTIQEAIPTRPSVAYKSIAIAGLADDIYQKIFIADA
ncbi:MAG: FAD binding domain-containing protein [Clostridia bacterium]